MNRLRNRRRAADLSEDEEDGSSIVKSEDDDVEEDDISQDDDSDISVSDEDDDDEDYDSDEIESDVNEVLEELDGAQTASKARQVKNRNESDSPAAKETDELDNANSSSAAVDNDNNRSTRPKRAYVLREEQANAAEASVSEVQETLKTLEISTGKSKTSPSKSKTSRGKTPTSTTSQQSPPQPQSDTNDDFPVDEWADDVVRQDTATTTANGESIAKPAKSKIRGRGARGVSKKAGEASTGVNEEDEDVKPLEKDKDEFWTKRNNPARIPKFGEYYLHDDRDLGGRRGRGRGGRGGGAVGKGRRQQRNRDPNGYSEMEQTADTPSSVNPGESQQSPIQTEPQSQSTQGEQPMSADSEIRNGAPNKRPSSRGGSGYGSRGGGGGHRGGSARGFGLIGTKYSQEFDSISQNSRSGGEHDIYIPKRVESPADKGAWVHDMFQPDPEPPSRDDGKRRSWGGSQRGGRGGRQGEGFAGRTLNKRSSAHFPRSVTAHASTPSSLPASSTDQEIAGESKSGSSQHPENEEKQKEEKEKQKDLSAARSERVRTSKISLGGAGLLWKKAATEAATESQAAADMTKELRAMRESGNSARHDETDKGDISSNSTAAEGKTTARQGKRYVVQNTEDDSTGYALKNGKFLRFPVNAPEFTPLEISSHTDSNGGFRGARTQPDRRYGDSRNRQSWDQNERKSRPQFRDGESGDFLSNSVGAIEKTGVEDNGNMSAEGKQMHPAGSSGDREFNRGGSRSYNRRSRSFGKPRRGSEAFISPEIMPNGSFMYPDSVQNPIMYAPAMDPSLAMQPMLTGSGHVVLMTDNGLMIPSENY
ncbi:hypothetical protein HDU76_003740, partial [Blyttiomyces sp. JEL0837]